MNRQTSATWIMAGLIAAGMLLAGTAGAATVVSVSSGYWTNTAVVWGGTAPDGQDVVICAGHTITNTGTSAISINSLTITGTLTHAAVTTAGSTVGDEDNMINLSIAGNLTIDTEGKINVDGMGYAADKGPGAGSGDRGAASYGGKGTIWTGSLAQNPYGSITNPVNSGSGGTLYGRTARVPAGGGAVVILVTGAITNNGTITAKGNTASTVSSGSGGTINLTANSIASTGIICADGIPSAANVGASGGGRIALRLTGDGQDFANVTTNNISAYGGTTPIVSPDGSPDLASSAGTIYLKTKVQPYGTLIVKNNSLNTTLDTPVAVGTNRFDAIYVQAKGILGVSSTRLLDLTGCTLSSDSPAGDMANSRVEVVTTAGGGQFIVGPAAYTIPTNVVISFKGTNRMSLTCDLTIASGGILTHEAVTSTGSNPENNRLSMDLVGNLTIASTGLIDVDGKGYAATQGPGAGSGDRGAASYGGKGTIWTGSLAQNPYGSITNPVNSGSGGNNFAGGGAVVILVTGAITNSGTITAKGNTAGDRGNGSGGTINLTAASITSTGIICADGIQSASNVGASGGGRIALRLTGDGQDFANVTTDNITAYGATTAYAPAGEYASSAGTIYLKTKAQTYGTLLVKNNNLVTSLDTLISSTVTDATVGDVVLKNLGYMGIAAGQTLTVYGSWSNAVATNALSGAGTVEFKGATTNTIYGSTTFNSLVCTNAGKTLLFQAGTTNTVTAIAGLRLTGASGAGNKVSLLPATPSTQWYIKSVNTPANVSYVAVSNSTVATSGGVASITAQNSDDLGGNTNWVFANPDAITWISPSDTNWNTPANWVTAGGVHRAPVADDPSITISNNTATATLIDASYVYNGNLIVQSGATMNLNGKDLTIGGCLTNAGTLVATSSETLTVSKDVDFTGGNFTPANSTFRLAAPAAGAQTIKPDGKTFYRIEVPNVITLNVSGGGFTAAQLYCRAANAQLNFNAGSTYAVTDLLDLRGTAGNLVKLRSSGLPTKWNLNLSGQRQMVRYVDVRDSDASAGGGRMIYAIDSTDSASPSTVNWDFNNGKFWTGGSDSLWSTAANWSPSDAPGPTNYVIFDGTGNAPTLSGSATIAGLNMLGPVTATVNMAYGQILNVSNDVYIGNSAGLTHSAVTSTGSNLEDNRLLMRVGGDFTLVAGGTIDVSEKGYDSVQGPGAGSSASDARGGRIAMRLTTGPDTQFGALTIQAYGGPEKTWPGAEPGAAGTIYLKGANQSYGRLLVDHNLSTPRRTLISSNVTDAAVGDVVLKTLGYIGIATGQTLTVYGSWSNAVATMTGGTNYGGTVVFAGTSPNPVYVWGGNTWSNLTIATASKIVCFEHSKTQTVYGLPTFDNLVTLKSTSKGLQWNLIKGSPGATQDVGNVYVEDSDASAGNTFNASGGADLGNSLNWIFPRKGTVFMLR